MKTFRWLVITLVAVLMGSHASAAAQVGPMAAPPAAQAFKIGALSAWSLHDAQFVALNDGKTFGLGVPTEQVAQLLREAGAPPGEITLSVNVLLVKFPGRIMLFDTGLGAGLHGGLLASLALTGVKPSDVTDVFITHSHGDHIGGLAAGGQLVFPDAAIHMSAREWAFMRSQSPTLAATISPKVATFLPGIAVAPGVTPIDLGGHTPGHVGYVIVSGQDRLTDIGDIAHSSILSLARPDWSMGFDSDKSAARARRRQELDALAARRAQVFAPHFPFPGVGEIVPALDGFAWAPRPLK